MRYSAIHTLLDQLQTDEKVSLKEPYGKVDPSVTRKIARFEFLVLKESRSGRSFRAVLSPSRGNRLATRYFYRGAMYDLLSTFKTELMKYTDIEFPSTSCFINKGEWYVTVVNRRSDQSWATALEHCLVDGEFYEAIELVSEGQVDYFFKCLASGDQVDTLTLKALASEGLTPAFISTMARRDRPSLVPPLTPAVNFSVPRQSSAPDASLSAPSFSAPCQSSAPDPFAEIISRLKKLEADVLDINRKFDAVSFARDVDLKVDKAIDNLFDSGILLNAKGEEFIIHLFDRIDALRAHGVTKRDAYKTVLGEMNDPGHFKDLMEAFIQCRKGQSRRPTVTYFNIEDYYTKVFELCIDSHGRRRVLHKWPDK